MVRCRATGRPSTTRSPPVPDGPPAYGPRASAPRAAMGHVVSCDLLFDIEETALVTLQVAAAGRDVQPGGGRVRDERLDATTDGRPLPPPRELVAAHGSRLHVVDAPPGTLAVSYRADLRRPGGPGTVAGRRTHRSAWTSSPTCVPVGTVPRTTSPGSPPPSSAYSRRAVRRWTRSPSGFTAASPTCRGRARSTTTPNTRCSPAKACAGTSPTSGWRCVGRWTCRRGSRRSTRPACARWTSTRCSKPGSTAAGGPTTPPGWRLDRPGPHRHRSRRRRHRICQRARRDSDATCDRDNRHRHRRPPHRRLHDRRRNPLTAPQPRAPECNHSDTLCSLVRQDRILVTENVVNRARTQRFLGSGADLVMASMIKNARRGVPYRAIMKVPVEVVAIAAVSAGTFMIRRAGSRRITRSAPEPFSVTRIRSWRVVIGENRAGHV